MKRLLLFNPDNDMALADGTANYMAPAIIRRMATDLALLPAWIADNEDAILAASAYNDTFLKEMNHLVGLPAQLVTPPELSAVSREYAMSPWGWSLAVRERLLRDGADESSLPTIEEIAVRREMSHRSTAVEILRRLREKDDERLCGRSYLLSSVDECLRFRESHERCLLKAPLSSSGKGLNWCVNDVEGWCRQVIERQGSVIGEPVYDKVADFAMEFKADGKGLPSFIGYSLFRTSKSGAYTDNLLLSDEEIERWLSDKVPSDSLNMVRHALPQLLKERIGRYEGYVGVDMMICRRETGEGFMLHPCVEVNLRCNMGVVANTIYKRYLSDGARGIFRIDYHPKPGMALEAHNELTTKGLEIRDGRIASGYLPLTPVTKHSQYNAYLLLDGALSLP
jgi:hypothetical protein